MDQEFDTGPIAVFLFPVPREDSGNCLSCRQKLLRPQEGVKQLRLIGNGPQSAADVHFKTSFFFSATVPFDCDQPQIVHVGEATAMVPAAAEGRLELPAEVLRGGMSQQESGKGAGIRGDVESLVRADTGVGASGDIAHRVAASLAGGDLDRGQPPHQCGRIVNLHIVQLEVLSGRDVRNAIGIFLGQIRQSLQLLRIESSVRGP